VIQPHPEEADKSCGQKDAMEAQPKDSPVESQRNEDAGFASSGRFTRRLEMIHFAKAGLPFLRRHSSGCIAGMGSKGESMFNRARL
jgi:hypothetical protein